MAEALTQDGKKTEDSSEPPYLEEFADVDDAEINDWVERFGTEFETDDDPERLADFINGIGK